MIPGKLGSVTARGIQFLFVPYKKKPRVTSQQHAHNTTTARFQSQIAVLPMAHQNTVIMEKYMTYTRSAMRAVVDVKAR